MNICVIGLGKIGLPLAVHFAKMGNSVIGSDINQETVNQVNAGREPFPEEHNLQEYLSEVIDGRSLIAMTDNSIAVAKSEVIVVVVPLFVNADSTPDFRALDAVTQDIGKSLKKGMLVSYETTLPIGTTRERFLPVLEELSGLRAGQDFNLVFSPERVLTGRVFSDLRKYPKIVGGISPSCTKAGFEFYSKVIDFDQRSDLPKPNGVWVMDSSESAEFVKLAETTYRDVNIGLANQFSKFAIDRHLDIHAVISAANSQPYSHIHQPGISVGGHCIPIYPQFYIWNDPMATIVAAARDVNKGMPAFYVSKLEEKIGNLEGKSILVLGVSYREKVKETAFSGAFDVRDSLISHGAKPYFIDPLYSQEELMELGFDSTYNDAEIDGLILHTKHQEFLEYDFQRHTKTPAVIDGRNFLEGFASFESGNRVSKDQNDK
jgi:UDP-N-acetyl-D-glucosamine dehydrogenase